MSRFVLAKYACEAIALVAVTGLFFLHPAIRHFITRNRHRALPWLVVVFFTAHAFAQFFTRNQYVYPQRYEPFPFTRWAMFAGMTSDTIEAAIYDWRARCSDGTVAFLNPAHLFVTPNATVHFTKSQAIGSDLASKNLKVRKAAANACSAYARGLAKRYQQLHPDVAVTHVELWERRYAIAAGVQAPEPFKSPHCKLVYVVAIPR